MVPATKGQPVPIADVVYGRPVTDRPQLGGDIPVVDGRRRFDEIGRWQQGVLFNPGDTVTGSWCWWSDLPPRSYWCPRKAAMSCASVWVND